MIKNGILRSEFELKDNSICGMIWQMPLVGLIEKYLDLPQINWQN